MATLMVPFQVTMIPQFIITKWLGVHVLAGVGINHIGAMEYRHGPAAVTDSRSVVWLLGPTPAGLVDDIAAAGGLAWSAAADPMAELVRVHLVALAIARARGFDSDRPRNLTRSVILTSAKPGTTP